MLQASNIAEFSTTERPGRTSSASFKTIVSCASLKEAVARRERIGGDVETWALCLILSGEGKDEETKTQLR
jgi:hypothetical protein